MTRQLVDSVSLRNVTSLLLDALTCRSFFQFELGDTAAVASAAAWTGFAFRLLADADAEGAPDAAPGAAEDGADAIWSCWLDRRAPKEPVSCELKGDARRAQAKFRGGVAG